FGHGAQFLPGQAMINPSAFALVGMGAFLAATTHAPIMAIIMIFELTLDYQIMLPLMLACVVAYYVSSGIEKRSIYAAPLRRKGAGDYRRQLAELHVRDIMKENPLAVSANARFEEIGQQFIAARVNYLYVTEKDRFLGAISLHDIKSYLNSPELAGLVIAGDIMHERFPSVPPEASLTEAMECFVEHDGERLPVVTPRRQLLGSISKTDVILGLAGSNRSLATTQTTDVQ
ncbi:MAG: chloride channel protein, partial [Chthoniobacterales bacterium]